MIKVERGEKNNIVFTSNVRSSVASKKEFIRNQICTISDIIGASYTMDGIYPAWEYDRDSKIRKIFLKAYENIYSGQHARVESIHAGLECGIISDKFKKAHMDVDLITLGPNIFGAHTPQEHVSISSVGRTWGLLKEVLRLVCTPEYEV